MPFVVMFVASAVVVPCGVICVDCPPRFVGCYGMSVVVVVVPIRHRHVVVVAVVCSADVLLASLVSWQMVKHLRCFAVPCCCGHAMACRRRSVVVVLASCGGARRRVSVVVVCVASIAVAHRGVVCGAVAALRRTP